LLSFVFRMIANTFFRNRFIAVSLAAEQPLGLWRSFGPPFAALSPFPYGAWHDCDR
jgi:hypothetical protein